MALDVGDPVKALDLVDQLRSRAGMFKVGMELFYSAGGGIIKEIKKRGCGVFLDLKLHDIPNTAAAAARILAGYRPDMVNVHASGGPEMMRAAVAAVRDEAARGGARRPLVIAVTVLTSIDRDIFGNQLGIKGEIAQFVSGWSKMALECGLDGVVASPREAPMIREICGKEFIIITPGVRPSWHGAGDQKRVATPGEAISAGATYIVVGRPITGSANPPAAAEKILEEIKGCAG